MLSNLNLRIVLLCFSLVTVHLLKSQEVARAKNTIYTEIIGNAGSLSLNYDRIIYCKKMFVSVSVGAGMMPINISNGLVYGIPISCNFFMGKRNHHIELSAGMTYHQGMYGVGKFYTETLFAVVRAGYRFQKQNEGFFWKAGFTPFFPIAEYGKITNAEFAPTIYNLPIIPLAGISFGYTF
jgi:hypothetical protein